MFLSRHIWKWIWYVALSPMKYYNIFGWRFFSCPLKYGSWTNKGWSNWRKPFLVAKPRIDWKLHQETVAYHQLYFCVKIQFVRIQCTPCRQILRNDSKFYLKFDYSLLIRVAPARGPLFQFMHIKLGKKVCVCVHNSFEIPLKTSSVWKVLALQNM